MAGPVFDRVMEFYRNELMTVSVTQPLTAELQAMKLLGVGRNTVRSVLTQLLAEGRVKVIPTKGYFKIQTGADLGSEELAANLAKLDSLQGKRRHDDSARKVLRELKPQANSPVARDAKRYGEAGQRERAKLMQRHAKDSFFFDGANSRLRTINNLPIKNPPHRPLDD